MTDVFILLWGDEHEKTEEKTEREIESSGTLDLMGVHRDTYKRVRGRLGGSEI
jgi:hypothetical protein